MKKPLAHTRQFTCRYWALGPSCPDVSQTGRINCPYSHYDTGRLNPPSNQLGTCLTWGKSRVCLRFGCPYEHRETGVTGMNQGGPLELRGIEADIANAAYRSGFNTCDHAALYELIWAVKKTAIRNRAKQPRFRGPPKPPHPVYPDRYRPSGIGDNTRAKRKRADYDPNEPLRFHPVKPLGARKTGTKHNPISLDSDDENDAQKSKPANSSAKRRKIDDGGRSAGGLPDSKIVLELMDVRSRFIAVRRDMNQSQNDMKALFDKHYQHFDDDEIMRILNELSDNMNATYDGAKSGMDSVDRGVAWLNGKDCKIE